MYVKIPKERDSDLPYPRHIQDCKFRLWPEKNRPSHIVILYWYSRTDIKVVALSTSQEVVHLSPSHVRL